MPRKIRRPRIITCRLSNEEFVQFQSLRDTMGADGFSELIRHGLRLLANSQQSNGKDAIESRVELMDARMSELASEVARISSLLAGGRLDGNNGQH